MASSGGSVPEYPICPRCKNVVRYAGERHELRLQLVNADASAPKASTDYHGVFHHRCAQEVWRTATEAWRGYDL